MKLLQPVDRDVSSDENRYYDALKHDAPCGCEADMAARSGGFRFWRFIYAFSIRVKVFDAV